MRALFYTGPQMMELRETADPAPAKGEVLIEIVHCGICGSDMHAFLGHDDRRPAPLILGHEGTGTIRGGARDGERVTINPLVTCGTCEYCTSGRENLCQSREIISMPPRSGAFAEYVAMPEENLVTLPDEISFAKAALAEPIAVSWHAAKLGLRALDPNAEREILVIGGGAIGVAAALAFRAMGLSEIKIVEPNDDRRAYLERTLDFPILRAAEAMHGIVVDAVGYGQTRQVASAHVRPGGLILHIGLGNSAEGLDLRRVTLQEISFIGTYCYTKEDFRETAAAIFDGRLGRLDWTEIRSLERGLESFNEIRAGQVLAPKILLTP